DFGALRTAVGLDPVDDAPAPISDQEAPAPVDQQRQRMLEARREGDNSARVAVPLELDPDNAPAEPSAYRPHSATKRLPLYARGKLLPVSSRPSSERKSVRRLHASPSGVRRPRRRTRGFLVPREMLASAPSVSVT